MKNVSNAENKIIFPKFDIDWNHKDFLTMYKFVSIYKFVTIIVTV